VITALASAKPMKMLLKIDAVRKKPMVRMTAPRIKTRTDCMKNEERGRPFQSLKVRLWKTQKKTGPHRTG
jgi:hypothetical protein